MGRMHWDSRTAFVFAAIGSAAGLGNLWRFPYAAYTNGGGAFLIPYVVALLTAGLPLLILELSLGQRFQKGAPGAWKCVDRRLEGLGWWGILVAFVIVSYYAVIIAWAFSYIYFSFDLSWAGHATSFFKDSFLSTTSGPGELGHIVAPILAGLAITWIWIYASIRKGPESMSKVVWITVPLPVILLVVMILRGITLDGATDGLMYFLKPDFSMLLSKDVWLAAYSQVFFSVSVGGGSMLAYGSYKKKDADVTKDACIIGIADTVIAFMAGIAVFSILGYMALQQAAPVDTVVSAGFGLAFSVFPSAIELMPFAPGLFGIIFFMTLLTLAIDSAFSFVEAIDAALVDSFHWSISHTAAVMSVTLFCIGVVFCTGGGTHWMDILDHFVNSYGLALIGLIEVLAIGWWIGTKDIRSWINSVSDWRLGRWWDVSIRYLAPLGIGSILALSLWDDFVAGLVRGDTSIYGSYPMWANVLGLLLIVGVVPFLAWVVLPRKQKRT